MFGFSNIRTFPNRFSVTASTAMSIPIKHPSPYTISVALSPVRDCKIEAAVCENCASAWLNRAKKIHSIGAAMENPLVYGRIVSWWGKYRYFFSGTKEIPLYSVVARERTNGMGCF